MGKAGMWGAMAGAGEGIIANAETATKDRQMREEVDLRASKQTALAKLQASLAGRNAVSAFDRSVTEQQRREGVTSAATATGVEVAAGVTEAADTVTAEAKSKEYERKQADATLKDTRDRAAQAEKDAAALERTQTTAAGARGTKDNPFTFETMKESGVDVTTGGWTEGQYMVINDQQLGTIRQFNDKFVPQGGEAKFEEAMKKGRAPDSALAVLMAGGSHHKFLDKYKYYPAKWIEKYGADKAAAARGQIGPPKAEPQPAAAGGNTAASPTPPPPTEIGGIPVNPTALVAPKATGDNAAWQNKVRDKFNAPTPAGMDQWVQDVRSR